jgi:hypothetical protein
MIFFLQPLPLIRNFPSLDYWNCTKRFAREKCDYTLKGLQRNLPKAFLSVSTYWVRKAFERADRFLGLYDMEITAMPFQLRDFMVKTWKRHRDVPTKICQLVDRAVEDLQRRQQDLIYRMTKNKIKMEPLEKVEHLLDCCYEVAEKLPDNYDIETQDFKDRLKSIKRQKEALDLQLSNTQVRFRQLAKRGRLGQAGAVNWQWATSEAHTMTAIQPISESCEEPCTNPLGTGDEYSSVSPEILNVVQNPRCDQTDEWVECVACSQWRRLLPGTRTSTLPDDWKCSDGDSWRPGLNCNEPPDVEEDVSHRIT